MDLLRGIQGMVKSAPGINIRQKELGFPANFGFSFLGGRWVMLPDNYHTYIDNGFQKVPYIYAIIDHIAEKFSDPPRELMQITDDKKARGVKMMLGSATNPEHFFKARMLALKAFEKVDESHPFYKLMDSPNPITPTEKSFNYSRCGYLALTGNSYCYSAVPGSGENAKKPLEWWVIPSPITAPVAGDKMNPIAGYKTDYFDNNLPTDRVQHVKLSNFISTFSGLDAMLVGMSPLKSLTGTTSQTIAADKAQGTAFENMAPAGVLNGEQNQLDDEDMQAIQDGFLQRHTGQANWKKIITSPSRIHWTEIGFSPVDMQILEFMDKAEEKYAKVYHYPLGLLNDKGEVANQTVNRRALITDAVMPYIRRFDDADTKEVRQWYGNPKLQVMTDLQYFAELQEDMQKVAQWLKDCYWLTIEEKRRVQDYEEEWRGTMLVPSGLDTIENVTGGNLDGGETLEL